MLHRAINASIILLIFPLAVLILLLWQPAEPTYSQMETPTASSYIPYVSVAPLPTAPPPTATTVPPQEEGDEQATAAHINTIRSDNGLPALVLVGELTQSARRHSRDMADKNFTGHQGSDGTYGCERMLQAGYIWSACTEIIGWGFGGSSEAMIDWWWNSQPHRDTILSSNYEDFGVGQVVDPTSDWGHYWTVNFGTRASAAHSVAGKIHKCTYRRESLQGGSSLQHYSKEPCPHPVSPN